MRIVRTLCAAAVAATLAGCSSIRVASEPPGARVVWSPDGVEEYREWPPNSAELGGGVPETPLGRSGFYGKTLFVTVEKDGYRRPLPKLVQLHPFRSERLAFDLVELPETVAARMKANGFLFYQEKWVDPAAAGVVEYEGVVMPTDAAYLLGQLSKGLVEYKGQWLTAEAKAAREEADYKAEGLVQYKGRWITPEAAETEARIDAEVAAVAKGKDYPDIEAPRMLGRSDAGGAQVQMVNSTPQAIRFLFSGPISREFAIQPFRSFGVSAEERTILDAGRYEIAVIPSTVDAAGRNVADVIESMRGAGGSLRLDPSWASWPLASGSIISFNYTGIQGDLQESLTRFDEPTPELNVEQPVIEIPEIEIPRPETPRRFQGDSGPGGGGGRNR